LAAAAAAYPTPSDFVAAPRRTGVISVFAAHLTTAPSPCSFRGHSGPSSTVGAEVVGQAAMEESGWLPCLGRSGDAAVEC
jgi:hypothetical protein